MSTSALLRHALLGIAGLLLGGLSAVVEVIYVLVVLPTLVVPSARRRAHAWACRLAEAERTRVGRYFGSPGEVADFDGPRALRYLFVRSVIGMFGVGVLVLVTFGAASSAVLIWQMITGQPVGGGDPPDSLEWTDPILVVGLGAILLFLAIWGLFGVATMEVMTARYFLGPTEQDQLRRRVSELATSRAGVVEAINQERRRIERDLHDGVQQRLVALGMLLGRARRANEPAHVDELIRLAHEEAQQSLSDLREVTWRVYPIALDQGGLHPALETVAERSSVPVRLAYELADRPDPATETVAYFVVSEAVTNAIKHGAPSRIDISVQRAGEWLDVRVCDDGNGGAKPTGTGLSGLARRVAAADGEFDVDSPAGGPTTVAARLPCG